MLLLKIMNDLKSQLKKIIKGDVSNSRQVIQKYSHDASLFEIKPKLIVFPKDNKDLQALVKFVNNYNSSLKRRLNKTSSNADWKKNRLTLTARAAGTDMTGGPLNNSIIIDCTRYLNKIKKIGKNYAIVQPGVYYRDFEKAAAKKNLLLPSYPASKNICALGGMIANNSGGEKTLAYGKTANYVEELKVILKDGKEYTFRPLTKTQLNAKIKKGKGDAKIYSALLNLITAHQKIIQKNEPQVSKNSSGYLLSQIWDNGKFNLAKIFVGAQGTLGIITEIKLKLIRPKKHSQLLVIFLNDIKPLAKVVNKVLQFHPESFEVFDDNTLKLGMRFLFKKFAWQFLPEIWLIVRNKLRLPKLVLLAEFTGDNPKEVQVKAQHAQEALSKFHLISRITSNKKDTQKYWAVRRESFNLLRHKVRNKKAAPFIDDLIVKPEHLPKFIPQLNKILKKYTRHTDITYTIAGHIGDGNLHIIPLMDLTNNKSRSIIAPLTKEVYSLVFKFHGSMSAEHNDGLIRTPFIKQMFGPKMYQLFKQVKSIFDPENIFNPDKKVTDLSPSQAFKYAISHLKQE